MSLTRKLQRKASIGNTESMPSLNRRYFMIGSAVASQAAFSQTPGDRIATAMIGTGSRGTSVMRGVLEQPNARVAAVCDIKPARLDAAATVAAKDKPDTYTDYRKVIERKDI